MQASNEAGQALDEDALADAIADAMASVEPDGVSPAIERKLMTTLFSAQSIFNAANTVSFTVLPIAAVAITGNAAVAGLPSTITLIARTIVAWPIGWLMDRLGRRLGISIGLSASVFGLIISGMGIIWGNFPVFLFGAFFTGLGRGTGEQSRYAAADIVPANRAASAIATVVFAGTIGSVLGPFLNTPSREMAASRGLDPLSGPFFLAAIFTVIALLIIFVLLRPDPTTLSRQREALIPDILRPARSLRELFSAPKVQLAVVALAISQLVMVMIMIITPLYMEQDLHSPRAVEWVIAVHILGMFALSNVTGEMVRRFGAFKMIGLAGLVLGSAAILAPMAQNVWLLGLALFLLGLGWNFGFVAGSALLAASFTGPEKGQAQGAAETLVAAASALGSIAIGPSFQWGGYLAVSMIGLAFALAMLGYLFTQRGVRASAAV